MENKNFIKTGDVFQLVSEFELTDKQLRIAFDGYPSIDAISSDSLPIPNLRRDFIFNEITPIKFEQIQTEFGELLDRIKYQALRIAEVDENYTLEFFQILTIKKVMVIHAVKEGDKVHRTKTNPEYKQIFAENSELVFEADSIAWQIGKNSDLFLASLS